MDKESLEEYLASLLRAKRELDYKQEEKILYNDLDPEDLTYMQAVLIGIQEQVTERTYHTIVSDGIQTGRQLSQDLSSQSTKSTRMSDENITAVEVQETEYGEKVAVRSPYDAKEFFNVLPFEKGDTITREGVADGAVTAAEDFDFSNDYGSYGTWDPNAFGVDDGGWLIDAGTWEETKAFFEHCGFTVEDNT